LAGESVDFLRCAGLDGFFARIVHAHRCRGTPEVLNFAPSLGGARSCGQWLNSKTFAADALLYFVVLAALLRARRRIGLGATRFIRLRHSF
jgi:hypothetical protein